jgi:glycylpeptide N-tetradecanoyltransferase
MINIKNSKLLFQKNKIFPPDLPYEIEWFDLGLLKIEKINKIFSFLDYNYIEDTESLFRFHYIHEFLALALKAPSWSSFLNIGLKYKRTNKLIGVIISTPKEIIVSKNLFCAPDINFLCLNKKIRNKRFVEILIKEIERRLNLTGVKKAVYTSSLNLPKPLFFCNYYHYAINKHKLVALGYLNKFTTLKPNTKPDLKFRISTETGKSNYLKVREKFSFYKIYRYFKVSDFLYWFKNIPGVIYIFYVENFGKILIPDMFTFYCLPSRFINKKKNLHLHSIYFFYKTNLFLNKKIFFLVVKTIEKLGFDIINTLDSNKNKKKLLKFNFVKGNGKLNFHIFNYINEKIDAIENGLQFF